MAGEQNPSGPPPQAPISANVEILPILSSLRRHKSAVVLIGLQIALTLSVVCNFMSIVQQRMAHVERPTGIDEANIFTIQNQWLGDTADLKARIETDLATIRAVPDVVDAYVTNSVPLLGHGRTGPIFLSPDKQSQSGSAEEYFADEHGINTLNIRLVRGRWLTAADVEDLDERDTTIPVNVVVTQQLADFLFPRADALGRIIYPAGSFNPPNRVVGIVEHVQTDWAFQSSPIANGLADDSIFLPYRLISKEVLYVVRTRPGSLLTARRTVQKQLYSLSQDRLIEDDRTFGQIRADAYRSLRWSIIPLSAICILLLIVTAGGIIGLNTYWVSQRRRYIGMRRALGARRIDILRYIHLENLLISAGACIAGTLICLVMNIWLASIAEVTRMSLTYVCFVALAVIVLCQASVLWPAFRASLIAPATASRGL
jgi:putative ABC transport system permease protein